MSSKTVPRLLPVRKSAASAAKYLGQVNSSDLSRVCSATLGSADSFDIDLEFLQTESGKAGASLKVKGNVSLQCQRCLKAVGVDVNIVSQLVFVAHDDEAKALLKHAEPWVVLDDQLDVYQLIEDEILLSLPAVALHERDEQQESDCSSSLLAEMQGGGAFKVTVNQSKTMGETVAQHLSGESEANAENPFSVLENLKLKH